MMEITDIAKEAISTIAPYLAAGGTELIKGASADLWKSIKGVFKNKDETKLLEQLESSPTDLKTIAKSEYVLENELTNNLELAKALENLIKTVQSTEEYQNFSSQVGDDNISIQGKIENSKIIIKK